jgi:hypothetical protein
MSIETEVREEIERLYLEGKIDRHAAASYWIDALARDAFAGSDP